MLGVIFWTGLLPAAGMALTAGAGMPAGPAGKQEEANANDLCGWKLLLRWQAIKDRPACSSNLRQLQAHRKWSTQQGAVLSLQSLGGWAERQKQLQQQAALGTGQPTAPQLS